MKLTSSYILEKRGKEKEKPKEKQKNKGCCVGSI
jgi:hypothetical protein